MKTHAATLTTPHARPAHGAVLAFTQHAVATLGTWLDRHRQRAQLANLDEHLLRDIGISRGEASWECSKPFWQA